MMDAFCGRSCPHCANRAVMTGSIGASYKQPNDTDRLFDTISNLEQELHDERAKYKNLTQTMLDDCASFQS